MSITWKIRRLLKIIGTRITRQSNNRIYIHPTSTIIKSSLNGKGKIGAFSTISSSTLHGNYSVGDHSVVMHSQISGNIEIGRYTTFNGPGSDITARIHKVSIGNFCSIARNCTIQEFNHITNRCTTYYIHRNLFNATGRQEYIWQGSEEQDIESRGPIIIGNDVWIGAQSIILSGVTIGNGAVISANSTVTRDIPPYAIAAGSPAKVIKYRFADGIIDRLEELEWWYWDDETIRNNPALFSGALTMEKLGKINSTTSL
jgi:virginiamycin A acetyltransferase